MSGAYDTIRQQQKCWASHAAIKLDVDGYTFSLDDNLFLPLSANARSEFRTGRGMELGEFGTRGKMQALHSSSALVYNVFEYWRSREVSAIGRACGNSGNPSKLRFEARCPTGLPGSPPHLDVEFTGNSCEAFCIEAKFTEPYSRFARERTMKESYFSTPGLWAQLPRCREIAETLRVCKIRSRLDTPQLLKHILGLVQSFGVAGFRLLYLWYDFPSVEAEEHHREIIEFEYNLGGEVRFSSLTYQRLFATIREMPEAARTYVDWLQGRYFSS